VCAQVQRGLGSRTYKTGRFSVRRENAGYHFHRLVGVALGAKSETRNSKSETNSKHE
jgi:choline monooxygenase